MDERFGLTIGLCENGHKLAIISTGGHLQRPGSGDMLVLTVEVIDGWSKRRINDWFRQQIQDRPWETRQ